MSSKKHETKPKRKELYRDGTLMQMSDQRYINNDYQRTKRESSVARSVPAGSHAFYRRLSYADLSRLIKREPRILRPRKFIRDLARGKKKRRDSSAVALSRPENTTDLYCFKQSARPGPCVENTPHHFPREAPQFYFISGLLPSNFCSFP